MSARRAAAFSPANPRQCVRCRAPLPAGSTSRRAFCSDQCRVYTSRNRSVTNVGLWDQDAPELSVEPPTPAVVDHSTHSRPATSPHGSLAAIAAGIATPADEYGPARAYCEVRAGGHGVVFGRGGGRVNEAAGPVFPRPRQAIALADLLNGRLVPA